MSNIDKLQQKYNYKIVYQIKENKKVFVIILIIFLIAILLGSYAIYKNSSKTETASKIEKSEKLEKKAERKLKEAKKSGDKEEIAKAEKELKEAEEKTEEVKKTVSSSSASSSSANKSKSTPTATKPNASSSSGTTSTSKPKKKTKVWIVDKPAWDEVIYQPKYVDAVSVQFSNDPDAINSGNPLDYENSPYYERSQYNQNVWLFKKRHIRTDVEDCKNSYAYGIPTKDGYYVSAWADIDPILDPKGGREYLDTIHHPEQGHWEYR